jgi:hypothetical protein
LFAAAGVYTELDGEHPGVAMLFTAMVTAADGRRMRVEGVDFFRVIARDPRAAGVWADGA